MKARKCPACQSPMSQLDHGKCPKCKQYCGCSFNPTCLSDYCSRHRPRLRPNPSTKTEVRK